MAKTRTNSNSMTSILIAALNIMDSEFRKEILILLSEKINKNIPENTEFFDGMHTTLLYKEMKDKEVDIIARVPGKHTPEMMIEVKVSQGEELQKSQKEKGEYAKVSEKYDIPLIYIIPKGYFYEDELPKKSIIIKWHEILRLCDLKISMHQQIENFVENYSEEENFSEEEKKLIQDTVLLKKINTLKTNVIKKIREVLEKYKRNTDEYSESSWEAGFYYDFNKEKCYVGFNPGEDKNFLALCISEIKDNVEKYGKEKELTYYEGWFYIPILKSEITAGDEKVLQELRNALKPLKLSKEIKDNFATLMSAISKKQLIFIEYFEKQMKDLAQELNCEFSENMSEKSELFWSSQQAFDFEFKKYFIRFECWNTKKGLYYGLQDKSRNKHEKLECLEEKPTKWWHYGYQYVDEKYRFWSTDLAVAIITGEFKNYIKQCILQIINDPNFPIGKKISE